MKTNATELINFETLAYNFQIDMVKCRHFQSTSVERCSNHLPPAHIDSCTHAHEAAHIQFMGARVGKKHPFPLLWGAAVLRLWLLITEVQTKKANSHCHRESGKLKLKDTGQKLEGKRNNDL